MLYYPISMTVVGISWWKLSKQIPTVTRKFLLKYSGFLFVYTIFWIPIPLLVLLKEQNFTELNTGFEEASILLASSSGLAINLTRLMDKAVIKFLIKQFTPSKKSDRKSLLTSEITSFKDNTVEIVTSSVHHDSLGGIYYIDFFEEIHKQVNIIRLCYLHL